MIERAQALALVNNPAFDAVFDAYESQLFDQWIACNAEPDLVRLHLKAEVAREVKTQLKNTVIEINDRNSAA
jgi:hypothetical protein